MGVNRLNPVQKATYLKKIKSGKNEECTVTVKTELTSLVLRKWISFSTIMKWNLLRKLVKSLGKSIIKMYSIRACAP